MTIAGVLILIVGMAVMAVFVADTAKEWRRFADEQEHSNYHRSNALRADY